MVAARDRLVFLEGHARATARVLSAYQSQFELGRRTLLDVLNAANELYQARSAQVSGNEAFRLSQYQLLAAMDMLIPALGLSDELAKLDASAPRE
jgi:adhesin transport system outer membrane protein